MASMAKMTCTKPGMLAAARQHLGHHLFFTDVALGDVLDLDTGLGTQRVRPRADALAQRLDKARVVKDADALGVQKARHASRVTRPRQRARNHDAVVARQHPASRSR